ncbi:serine hydrolase domain-containing protein [Streptomyces hoynatensis]|uniref:Class A beta-lactamase-related serine hydrolase n=1 Tax=Streptomyces hoynatensis TaxID=1141874 RepID=A0A3A9Z1Y6_9ACTN|nr:serine hydrolase domain-containing protein [Streptomyces hoynatensis]RKN42431.1 class A beta-lactamase-related serine hydrolase [Streptomyces hoynatensis]
MTGHERSADAGSPAEEGGADAPAGAGAPYPAVVHGTVAPGFEPLRDTFAAVLGAEPGQAAQVAAYLDGRQVADLWGGPGMAGDSLLGVFSSTKGATFLVLALLAQRGTLDLDREVRAYWPEFAAEGKGALTLRELAGHRAGSIGVDEGFTLAELAEDEALAARLAPHRPYWRPGAAFGYHSLTIGALVGEVVRRASGASLRAVYREALAGPYGIDLYLGLPASEEHRFLDVAAPAPAPADAAPPAPDGLGGIAANAHHPESVDLSRLPNLPLIRAGGQGSVAALASARGLARLYAAALSGLDGRPALLSAATLAECAQPFSVGHDLTLGMHRAYGLGFMVGLPHLGAGAFGHDGAGGSAAFADPRSGLAFGYTRRRFPTPAGAGPDAEALARTARACALAGRS